MSFSGFCPSWTLISADTIERLSVSLEFDAWRRGFHDFTELEFDVQLAPVETPAEPSPQIRPLRRAHGRASISRDGRWWIDHRSEWRRCDGELKRVSGWHVSAARGTAASERWLQAVGLYGRRFDRRRDALEAAVKRTPPHEVADDAGPTRLERASDGSYFSKWGDRVSRHPSGRTW